MRGVNSQGNVFVVSLPDIRYQVKQHAASWTATRLRTASLADVDQVEQTAQRHEPESQRKESDSSMPVSVQGVIMRVDPFAGS